MSVRLNLGCQPERLTKSYMFLVLVNNAESPPLVTLQVASNVNKSPTLSTSGKSAVSTAAVTVNPQQSPQHPSPSSLMCLQPLQDGLQAMAARRRSSLFVGATTEQPTMSTTTTPTPANGNHSATEAQQQQLIDPVEAPATSLSWEQHVPTTIFFYCYIFAFVFCYFATLRFQHQSIKSQRDRLLPRPFKMLLRSSLFSLSLTNVNVFYGFNKKNKTASLANTLQF